MKNTLRFDVQPYIAMDYEEDDSEKDNCGKDNGELNCCRIDYGRVNDSGMDDIEMNNFVGVIFVL